MFPFPVLAMMVREYIAKTVQAKVCRLKLEYCWHHDQWTLLFHIVNKIHMHEVEWQVETSKGSLCCPYDDGGIADQCALTSCRWLWSMPHIEEEGVSCTNFIQSWPLYVHLPVCMELWTGMLPYLLIDHSRTAREVCMDFLSSMPLGSEVSFRNVCFPSPTAPMIATLMVAKIMNSVTNHVVPPNSRQTRSLSCQTLWIVAEDEEMDSMIHKKRFSVLHHTCPLVLWPYPLCVCMPLSGLWTTQLNDTKHDGWSGFSRNSWCALWSHGYACSSCTGLRTHSGGAYVKLEKFFYGLKQAPSDWYAFQHISMLSFDPDLSKSVAEHCFHFKVCDGE